MTEKKTKSARVGIIPAPSSQLTKRSSDLVRRGLEDLSTLFHQQIRLLIVDDIPENLRLLVGILGGQGYKVRAFSEGSYALESAYARPPELILLDVKMPGMDGYAICEQLKADKRTHDIPVIFISALNSTTDKIRALDDGGVDYITKPFQAEEVLARVKTHLTISRLQRLERA